MSLSKVDHFEVRGSSSYGWDHPITPCVFFLVSFTLMGNLLLPCELRLMGCFFF
jgi:hypothetical protein